jgi:molecular chaperone GrpE (heat shock protein)
MRRSTPRNLGTAFLLLLAFTVPAFAADKGKGAEVKAPPTQTNTQPKLQDDIAQLSGQVDDLQASVKKIEEDMKTVEELRGDQQQLATRLEHLEKQSSMALVLLGLTAFFAAGALLLGLLQLRTVRALERRVGEVRERPGDLSFGSSPGEALEGAQAKAPEKRADLPLGGSVQLPARPAARTQPSFKDDSSRPELRRGEAVPTPPPAPHQKIARLLAQLQKEAPSLAEDFGDLDTRERFLGEFDAPLSARLERLKSYSEQGEAQLKERWLGPDLVTTLDALARFYSEAIEEGRQGRAAAKNLALRLRRWLYEDFSSACRGEGWFAIDPVDPYKTEFDPHVHHAVAGRDIDGASGMILAIKAIGRRDPKSGAVIRKAEVIVGR